MPGQPLRAYPAAQGAAALPPGYSKHERGSANSDLFDYTDSIGEQRHRQGTQGTSHR